MKNLTEPFTLRLLEQTIPEATPGPGPLIVAGARFVMLWLGMHISRHLKQVGISVALNPMLNNGMGTGPTGVGCK
nr:hypothetical protein [Roseibium polysiphoniae]